MKYRFAGPINEFKPIVTDKDFLTQEIVDELAQSILVEMKTSTPVVPLAYATTPHHSSNSIMERHNLEGLAGVTLIPHHLGDGIPTQMWSSGGRTALSDYEVDINLEEYGWGLTTNDVLFDEMYEDNPALQTFHVEVKGAGGDGRAYEEWFHRTGMQVSAASRICQQAPHRTTSIGPKIIRFNAGYDRPFGGQNAQLAKHSLDISSLAHPIKIAPTFAVSHLSPEVLSEIDTISDDLYSLEVNGQVNPMLKRRMKKGVPIAQEWRLTPGFLRPSHLKRMAGPIARGILGKFYTPDEMMWVRQRILGDVVRYVETYGTHTTQNSRGFTWYKVGDVSNHFKKPETIESFMDAASTNVQLFGKDMVIAPTGLYFVDLESIDPEYKSTPAKFKNHQEMSMGIFLKEMINLLHITDRFAYGSEARYDDTLTDLIISLNASDHLHSYRSSTELTVKVNYPHIGTDESFRFDLEKLKRSGVVKGW